MVNCTFGVAAACSRIGSTIHNPASVEEHLRFGLGLIERHGDLLPFAEEQLGHAAPAGFGMAAEDKRLRGCRRCPHAGGAV